MPKSQIWSNFMGFLKNLKNDYDADIIEKFEK
jgi:hypothetical protein